MAGAFCGARGRQIGREGGREGGRVKGRNGEKEGKEENKGLGGRAEKREPRKTQRERETYLVDAGYFILVEFKDVRVPWHGLGKILPKRLSLPGRGGKDSFLANDRTDGVLLVVEHVVVP